MLLVTFFLMNYLVLSQCEVNQSDKKIVKPNIILMVADDLGFNDVPWHNNKVIAPNLKQLAAEGVTLEQSYVQPICSPTRSALLTGIYPFATGRQGDVIWPLTPTGLTTDAYIIPQLLKLLGYSTHAVGKWHLGFCNWKYTPTERGFDTFRGYYTGSEDYFSHRRTWDYKGLVPELHDEQQKLENESSNKIKQDYPKYPLGYDFRDNRAPYINATGIYSTYEFAEHVETLLRTSSPDVPKFLYLAFQSVHAPLQVPKNYTELYKNITNEKRRTYLGMVSAMDEAIGRIVKSLKDTGHYNNSVIVFTTDNGGPTVWGGNNWPLRGNKTTLWEGGTRGAAFINSPFLANKGAVSNNMIHVTDWMSTLVNLAGGLPPSMTDSIDQWDAINGRAPSPRNEIVYNINKNDKIGVQAAIRVGDYKLIIGDPGPGEWIPPPENRTSENIDKSSLLFSKLEKKEIKEVFELMKILANHCKTIQCFKKKIKFFGSKKTRKFWAIKKGLMKSIKQHIFASKRELFKNIGKEGEFLFHSSTSDQFNKEVKMTLKNKMPKEFIENINKTGLNSKEEEITEPELLITIKDMYGGFDSIEHFLSTSSDIRLYNLIDDPQEKVNLAMKQKNKVIELSKHLLRYKNRYVAPDEPKSDQRGNPKYWDGAWSPGWC